MKKTAVSKKTNSKNKNDQPDAAPKKGFGKLLGLALAALGVVYGDIGTSPLYAVNEIFLGHSQTHVTLANVEGCISLILWALTIVVTVKYLLFVLRADNDGEGGVFALFSLISAHKKKVSAILLILLIFTAGLLFGDGIITPAISVLSAIEGLKVAAPSLTNYVIPITIVILTGLFAIQYKGTSKVGKVFGPIMVCWFIVIALLGISQITQHPEIFAAFNPLYAINFLSSYPFHSLLIVLGSVMLTITGGEALFADMGHFGKKPIRLSWFSIVYPALMLNYLGQGAYLLGHTTIPGGNIFYGMVPAWALFPMIILSTLATIIASQALISGAFSIARQAIGLNLLPRLKILHTHEEHEGQIYIPFINWSLFVGCILLVLFFKSSNALASAYGLAVSGDMLATSLSMILISMFTWKWPPLKSLVLFGIFAIIDAGFLTANSLKFFEGGFIPFSIGVCIFIIMMTWRWGRKETFDAYTKQHTMTVGELIKLKQQQTHFLERSVIIMTPKSLQSESDNTPALMQLFWERYNILPKHLIFLDIFIEKMPYVHDQRSVIRYFENDKTKGSISDVRIRFGFMEEPDVEKVLIELAQNNEIDLAQNPADWLVDVSYERLIVSKKTSLLRKLKLALFLALRQNSQPAYYYFGLGNGGVNLSMEIMPVKID